MFLLKITFYYINCQNTIEDFFFIYFQILKILLGMFSKIIFKNHFWNWFSKPGFDVILNKSLSRNLEYSNSVFYVSKYFIKKIILHICMTLFLKYSRENKLKQLKIIKICFQKNPFFHNKFSKDYFLSKNYQMCFQVWKIIFYF